MLRTVRTLALVVALLALASSPSRADTWYMLLEGDNLGSISSFSGTVQQGVTDQTELLAVGQNLFLPLDAQGTPGALELRPIRVVKYVDGSSPLLAKAVATSEPITNCVLTRYTTGGTFTAVYSIELTGAQVIGVSMGSGDGQSLDTEVVTILYTGATITDIAGGQMAEIP